MVSLKNRHIIQGEPNFTTILPGPCQARCAFCVEPEGPNPDSLETFLSSFRDLASGELPPIFRTLSISGGEPTLSPVFDKVLQTIREQEGQRFKRVVLTTNGVALGRHLDTLRGAVSHVNLSRHAADDKANRRVFKTKKVPSAEELKELASKLNRRGIPVNLNCVYSTAHFCGGPTADYDRTLWRRQAKRLVSFAKDVGASSLVFRLDHRGQLRGPSALEKAFDDYESVHEDSCPSCRVSVKFIRGISVSFKQSAYEPTTLHPTDELYELVLHSDGSLCTDWSRRQVVERPIPQADWYNAAEHAAPAVSPLVDGCGQSHSCRPYVVFPESQHRVSMSRPD